jgi:hypothetical protein
MLNEARIARTVGRHGQELCVAGGVHLDLLGEDEVLERAAGGADESRPLFENANVTVPDT